MISHNEIKVEGPQSIIKSLDDEYIIKIEDQNIDSDYDEEVRIEDLNKFLTPNPDKINLSFKVAEFMNEEVRLNAFYVDDNFTIDTLIVVSYKIKKGEELTDADSLYINFIKDSGAITPEIVAPQKIKILNISPNSFILDK